MMKARMFFAMSVLMAVPAALMAAPALMAQDAASAPPAAGQQGPPPPPSGQHHWQGQGGPQGPGQKFGEGHEMHGREMRGHEMGSDGMHGHDGGMMGGRMLPPGTWWRSADVVAKVGLSTEQVKHIDEIFLQSRVKLIDEHAALEKEQLMLEPLLNANPVDQVKAKAEIGKIADERAELEKTDAGMLLGIRGVLTADQWTKLQADHGMRGKRGPGGPMPASMGRGARGGPGMGPKAEDDQLQ
jgi:Spy/CpxP family protein refolding chaperone